MIFDEAMRKEWEGMLRDYLTEIAHPLLLAIGTPEELEQGRIKRSKWYRSAHRKLLRCTRRASFAWSVLRHGHECDW